MYVIESRFNGARFRTQVPGDVAEHCGRLYLRGHTGVRAATPVPPELLRELVECQLSEGLALDPTNRYALDPIGKGDPYA